MQRRADHGTGESQPFGTVALHLGTQHQFRAGVSHGLFDRQVVVGDEGLQAQLLGSCPHLPGQLPAVATQAHHLKAQFLACNLGGGDGMGGIAKNEHPLAREVGGIHRAGIPGQPRWLIKVRCLKPQQATELLDEGGGGTDPDRDGAHGGHAKAALQPTANRRCDFGIEADIGIGARDPLQIRWTGPQGRHHGHVDAAAIQQARDLADVVAAAEPEQAWAQQIHPGPAALLLPALGGGRGGAWGRNLLLEQTAHQLIQGFRRPPVFLLGVGRQIQAHHGDTPQSHASGEGTGLVLDQFCCAAFPHQQGFWLEALNRLVDGAFDELGGVAAQVPGLEGGVGDRRAFIPPFDHGEQQIGVGVSLGGMQHVVHALHGCGNPQRTHMGRAFVCPEGEFHGG